MVITIFSYVLISQLLFWYQLLILLTFSLLSFSHFLFLSLFLFSLSLSLSLSLFLSFSFFLFLTCIQYDNISPTQFLPEAIFITRDAISTASIPLAATLYYGPPSPTTKREALTSLYGYTPLVAIFDGRMTTVTVLSINQHRGVSPMSVVGRSIHWWWRRIGRQSW